jgi:hypothetical protein
MEVVDFFRKPDKFRTSGARPPKGVLLVGPPGETAALPPLPVRPIRVVCWQTRYFCLAYLDP